MTLQRIKKHLLLMAAICAISSFAQPSETFTVTTLNVDGLPKRVLFLTINEDGPQEKYTTAISSYLAANEPDFIGVQENFNYDTQLYSVLSTARHHPWRHEQLLFT